MSAKAIYEACGKEILYRQLKPINKSLVEQPSVVIDENNSDLNQLALTNSWLKIESMRLVLKPDLLIKRRGKLGLVVLNKTLCESGKWLSEHFNKNITAGKATGRLRRVLVEPFLPHSPKEETYVCIYSHRAGDTILFYSQGGVDIGDVDSKALKLNVPIGEKLSISSVETKLLSGFKSATLAQFIVDLYDQYVALHCTYLEINPLVVQADKIYMLDLAMKLDQCAEYLAKALWGDIEFPTPFGRDSFPEEAYIQDLDAKSGSSLKLTIINEKGRVWTMVAGGGASVIYADTICGLGFAHELANYGEYSGAPTEQQTFDYARTILSLMVKEKHPDGKVLIIGGGIANFTNVAATFKGIVAALKKYQQQLIDNNISIYVRRAGPNYQEGLRIMRELGLSLGVPVHVFGPETHMTAICGMALGITSSSPPASASGGGFQASVLLGVEAKAPPSKIAKGEAETPISAVNGFGGETAELFSPKTKAIVWGMQLQAVQGMLDFDFVCKREEPSVVAITYPFTADHKQKFYWGHQEVLIPVYKSMADAITKHSSASLLVNFASFRSVFDSTMQALKFPQLNAIAVIAEGVPENLTRQLLKEAASAKTVLIGPATVGGIKPGCIKIGNTGGMLDNILSSRLHRPGSVAYVSRSGGLSNELNNIISQHTDGVFEGVAIGGDRYPGSTFLDHLLRYEAQSGVGMMVLLGEVGGDEEYRIIEAIKDGRLRKPVVAWCYGTCADMFSSEVQFGHAGSAAAAERETARAKNVAMKSAGCFVPGSFDDLGTLIERVFADLVSKGVITPAADVTPPTVPMDYNWARELGLIRKPASFLTSICDERGQELLYAGMPITDVLQQNIGVGGVLGLLWFQRRLPPYASTFLEQCLMVTADHGPAVSGAHNTIVCARAGRDLVSSLTSGLLTIGDRFGGALDGAAKQFSEAFDAGWEPMHFVNEMRKKGDLIMGIGHRVKSINNPDKRVELLKQFAKDNFPSTPLLDYAEKVERITTAKKPNLILNVDGLIGVAMVDLLRNCGVFSREEADDYINLGCLNAIFVLGRSIGFIGHYLDQKRLRQGLYRHPWDDISYIMPEGNQASKNQ